MKIVVHELTGSGLIQKLIPSKNVNVVAIRPHIYRHNSPSGSLKVQVLNSSDVVLAESNVVAISSIGSQAFFHGYVRFDIGLGLLKDTEYQIKIVGVSGYSFDESAYIGVCSDFDLRKYDATYSPNTGLRAALDLEVWSHSTI